MAKYQKYAEYKDSGVEWVDDIPSTWEVKPVFALFTPEMEKNLDGIETNVLSLSYGRIIQRDVENNHGLLPESFNTYQIVNDGDIILRLTDLQNDKRSLRVGLATQKGIITSAYLKLSALKEIDPKFAYRLLHSYDTTKVFYGMGGGLRQSMKFEDFRRLPILVPPKSEQTQIANFLDHETAQIDTLIAKQEKLIELLKEKRQAVISHAVTKGLNPNVPMKDSGVEWLGEVPEHWLVSPLKYLIASKRGAVKAGPFGSHLKNSDMEGGDVKVISQKNVISNDLYIGEAMISEQKYRELEVFTIEQDDILVTTRGTIGRTCIFKEKFTAILHPCLIRLQVDTKKVIPELIALIIQESGYEMEQILVKSNATTIEVIYSDNLINTLVVIPKNLSEQSQILNYISEQKAYFDKVLAKANQIIKGLSERRTAIISAAVTGKIDVRNWQHPNQKNNNNTELSA